jgi:hypothetical protein
MDNSVRRHWAPVASAVVFGKQDPGPRLWIGARAAPICCRTIALSLRQASQKQSVPQSFQSDEYKIENPTFSYPTKYVAASARVN